MICESRFLLFLSDIVITVKFGVDIALEAK